MKIVIFGGTTEGRELSWRLSEAGASVTVCVATEYGEEEQGRVPGVETRTGPLSPEEKLALLKDAALCIDATHPYAKHVTVSVKTACEDAGVEYLRLLRLPCDREGAVTVESAAEAAAYLLEREGRVLLTIGAKELTAYAGLAPERLFPRVLPSHESLAACEALGIPHRNIIAMQGPFSRALNAALIRQYGIQYVVTKDGGAPGGFPEKLAAAKETGARLIVLRRPEEDGMPFDEVLSLCMQRIGAENKIFQGEELP
jgi:precorrin-6x reductase